MSGDLNGQLDGDVRRWRRYPKYKDSGQRWFGEMPNQWEATRLKFCLRGIEQGWSPSCENRPAELHEWGVLKVGCVNGTQFDPDEQKALPPELEPIPALEIREGDVLMSRANTRELLGSASVVGVIRPRLLLCDKLYRLKVQPNRIDPSFLVLALGSGPSRYQMEGEATGASGSMQNIAQGTVWNLLIALPSLSEQRRILAFLTRETTKIDSLVAKKERLIELLQEKRTALISQVVTRGLDAGVPMGHSGLEWVDQIPAHWSVRRNVLLFHDRDERGFPDLPILEVSIRSGVTERQFSDEHVEQKAEDPGTYKRAKQGDIVFNKMRMWQGAVGVAPIDGLVSPDYTVAKPRNGICPRYYENLFRTSAYMTEVNRYSHGIVKDRNRLYWDQFKVMPSLFPPPDEQRQIVEHIGSVTAQTNALIAKVTQGIDKLREYRTALISAAVTGKIDVRQEGEP
jgi:type I restriction enzyme S subunit